MDILDVISFLIGCIVGWMISKVSITRIKDEKGSDE